MTCAVNRRLESVGGKCYQFREMGAGLIEKVISKKKTGRKWDERCENSSPGSGISQYKGPEAMSVSSPKSLIDLERDMAIGIFKSFPR